MVAAVHAVQFRLVHALVSIRPWFMDTHWGFPVAQCLHFIGLTLLVGSIGVFDLRLLGIGKRVPIATLHRLIPWGLAGYGVNLVTGALFLMTEPDQYIYNPAFHFKLLFMGIAGFNAIAFYLTAYSSATAPGAAPDAPRAAKLIALISLCCWTAVIVCGRLQTFYRPIPCLREATGVLAECILK